MTGLFDKKEIEKIFDAQAVQLCNHTICTVYGAKPASIVASASYETLVEATKEEVAS